MQVFGLTEWHFQDHRGVSTYNEPQMGRKKRTVIFRADGLVLSRSQKSFGIQWTPNGKKITALISPGSTFCADSYFGIRSTPCHVAGYS